MDQAAPRHGLRVLSDLLTRVRADRNTAIAVAIGSMAAVLLVQRTYAGAGSLSAFLQFTLIGISLGCVFAIAASGLVLTYTTTGVFNFAHGAVGMVAAFAYYLVNTDLGVPTPLALLLVLGVLAPAMGLALERLMRSFRGAPAGTALTVTIAITILLIGVVQYLFQSDGTQRTTSYLFGDRSVSIVGARIRYDEMVFLIVAIAVAIGLRYLLRVTRMGVAMRAVVDNPDLAALTGAPPVTIARTSWVLGAMLAALAGVLYAPTAGALDAVNLTFFVLSAYGAAVFGRLRSLPLTFAGAILLGLVQAYAPISFPDTALWSHLQVAVPGIFLFLVLLVLPDAKLAVGRVVGRNTPRVPSLPASLVRAAVFVPAVALAAAGAGDYLPDLSLALIYGTLILSLVLLTGYSGQISLAQYVFFGLGAFAMGKVAGGDSLLGLAAAAAIAVPLGVVTAVPAHLCTLKVHNRSRALAQPAVAGQERRPPSARQEAEILRVGLGGHGQPGLGGERAHLRLGQLTEGKPHASQRGGCEGGEHVGLVLGRICGRAKKSVTGRAGIVTRRKLGGPQAVGMLEHGVEPDAAVAAHARVRGLPQGVVGEPGLDHPSAELRAQVEGQVRHPHPVCDSARGPNGGGAAARGFGVVLRVAPELEGDGDRFAARACDQQRRDGGVDPSAHGDQSAIRVRCDRGVRAHCRPERRVQGIRRQVGGVALGGRQASQLLGKRVRTHLCGFEDRLAAHELDRGRPGGGRCATA